MRRFVSSSRYATLLSIVVACSPSPGGDSECVVPPASEMSVGTDLGLVLSANPVSPGQEALLSVAPAADFSEGWVSTSADWQCWNGTEWESTHSLFRGETQAPYVEAYDPERPELAIGLGATAPFRILIPDVAPGVYRIKDDVHVSSGFGPPTERTAVVLVWVR